MIHDRYYGQAFRLQKHEQLAIPGLELAVPVVTRLHWEVKNWVREEADAMQAADIPDIDPGDMTGACAIVSWLAKRILAELGVESSLVRGEFDGAVHCWLEVDYAVVDGTATQFGIKDDCYVTTPGIDCRYVGFLYDDDAEEDFHDSWCSQSPFRFQPALLEIERRIIQELSPRARSLRAAG